MLKLKALVVLMDFCTGHPRLMKYCFRPVANAPGLAGRLPVMVRAYMGADSFDIHDVDVAAGRIGIGGVDEIMFGSELLRVMHLVLGRMGTEEQRRALYDIGYVTGYYEAKDAVRKGKWAPSVLMPLITSGDLLERVRADGVMADFFDKVLQTESRIIINEGGWGSIESFDLTSTPIRVVHANSQEVAWMGPSDGPVCHYFTGGAAGHASAITGQFFEAVEVECAAAGAPKCVFEMVPAKETGAELERREMVGKLLALR
jgi:predicted hydrocarbon binding protein